MEYQNITSSVEKDIELIEVLSAISQVSGRMARNLELIMKQGQSNKRNCTSMDSHPFSHVCLKILNT